MSALSRLAAAFVAPDDAEPSASGADVPRLDAPAADARPWRRGRPPGRDADRAPHVAAGVHHALHVGVVARPADAAVAGCAIGLALAQPAAIVALWGAAAPKVHAPASLRARKAAGRLAARGHVAHAGGRLAVVALGEAVSEASRVAAAAAELPVVCVVAGPRDEAGDVVLAACDRVIVVGDDLVAELAAASLAPLGPACRSLVLPDGPSRALAASGAALVAPLRAPVLEALR